MENMGSGNTPENKNEREVRLLQARQSVQEVAGFLKTDTETFEEELFEKLKAELEDAAEVFLDEEMENERAYALGLYEELKKRKPESVSANDDDSRQKMYHKRDLVESKNLGSAIAEVGAINDANFIVRNVSDHMKQNELHFGQLSPTSEEIEEWRRKLDSAIAVWNDPEARRMLKELNDKFPNL